MLNLSLFLSTPGLFVSDLDPKLQDQLRSAFLSLEDESVLAPFKADGFAAVTDLDYDGIRKAGQKLGLDLGELVE